MKTEKIKRTVRVLWQGLGVVAVVLGLMAGNASALEARRDKRGLHWSGQNRQKTLSVERFSEGGYRQVDHPNDS